MEILNTYKVVEVPKLPSAFFFLLTISIGVFVFIAIFQFLDFEYIKGIIYLTLAVWCLAGFLWMKNYCKENYARERYEVKINSSMTAQELVENWNIIETRGKILVVERKGSNEN